MQIFNEQDLKNPKMAETIGKWSNADDDNFYTFCYVINQQDVIKDKIYLLRTDLHF